MLIEAFCLRILIAMNKKYLLLALIPTLIGLGGCNPSNASLSDRSAIAQETTRSKDVNTAAFASVLSTYVDDNGLVDYNSLQSDRQSLDAYNASLALTSLDTFESWSEEEKIAVLINAYNSLTLKSIVDQDPIKDSIKDIIGVWRFNQHDIFRDRQTLNNIEHDILRKNYNEPRIHAALVCAAISCPYLRQEPFTGENLDAQLDDQVRIFLSREEAFKIDRENNVVMLSAIFDWFGEDWIPTFGKDAGFAGSENQKAVLNFISEYVSAEDKAFLEAGGYDIEYSDYNWSLNRQS